MSLPSNIASLVITHLWQLTLLMLVVALLSRLLAEKHPKTVHGLWVLVLMKAVVPPLWASPIGLFSWSPAGTVSASDRGLSLGAAKRIVGDVESPTLIEAAVSLVSSPVPSRSAVVLVTAVWLVGVFVVLAAWQWRRRRLLTSVVSDSVEVPESIRTAVAEACGEYEVARVPDVIVTKQLVGPAVYGLFRHTLILPQPLVDSAGNEELKTIVAHELLHIRRGDTLLSGLQVMACAACWYYPAVWWASQEASRSAERCVDRDVVGSSGSRAIDYVSALIRVLELRCTPKPVVGTIGLIGVDGRDINKQRITSILRGRGESTRALISGRRLLLGALMLFLLPGRPVEAIVPQECALPRLISASSQSDAQAGQQLVKKKPSASGRRQG